MINATIDLTAPTSNFLKIRQAARVIESGGVVAYPTEAVYGLGCDPSNSAAVGEILRLKRRRAAAGLILIAAHISQLEGWIDPTAVELQRLINTPRTDTSISWVISAGPLAPDWITGGRPSIAVRITAHPIAAALCHEAGMPIVSTSANRHGAQPARSAHAARYAFGTAIDLILPGQTGRQSNPSEIRNAQTDAILRTG
jgi:L-threonylcarbamoyladenylate synthase